MGWGTFLLGRALRERRPQPGLLDGLIEMADAYNERQTDFESAVLSEIKLLNSQGKVVDLVAVRVNVKKMRKAYQQLGSRLDLMIVKEAQKRTLLGESVNYKEIERDIILAYRPFPWGQVFQWLFVPYVPAFMKIYKRSLNKDI